MSRMLSFYDAAWASARDLAAARRPADALAALAPLLGSPDAPPRLALLAHRLAARLHAAADRYRRARRHLRAALDFDAECAEVHYELGVAFEADPYGCDWRAARRFRKAVALAPREPRYAAALGRALVRTNRLRAGVRWLKEAANSADPDVLAVVVDGLCDAGRVRLARRVVGKALFRAPADRTLRRLWDEVRFASARAGQAAGAKAVGRGPVLLPFVRVVGEDGRVVRRDVASRPAPHLGRLRAYRAGQG